MSDIGTLRLYVAEASHRCMPDKAKTKPVIPYCVYCGKKIKWGDRYRGSKSERAKGKGLHEACVEAARSEVQTFLTSEAPGETGGAGTPRRRLTVARGRDTLAGMIKAPTNEETPDIDPNPHYCDCTECARQFEYEPLSLQPGIDVPSDLDFCSWGCLAAYAAKKERNRGDRFFAEIARLKKQAEK